MAFFARFWQAVRKQRRLVGYDLEGNRFYESPPGVIDPQRARRTVEYRKSGDLWDTAAGISRLPAQWNAWLAHTRNSAPTLDELKSDIARQEKVAFNVARLKQKEDEENRRRSQTSAILPRPKLDPNPGRFEPEPESISPQAPPSKPIGPTHEPQTWVPRSARK
ncbi:hypothetical protein JB92DRAFT_3092431 [Gautieria morchelliformis]|nr:hypothetical protein JB92DRAFT_3092431 [Gautieria morchelliformis]